MKPTTGKSAMVLATVNVKHPFALTRKIVIVWFRRFGSENCQLPRHWTSSALTSWLTRRVHTRADEVP